jgi:ATP-dependent Clp protease protease subunit
MVGSSSSLPDPAELLLERRVVTITGDLDGPGASDLAATLLTLDASGDDRIELRLSSCRGGIDAALTVVDVIDVLGVPVRATALGLVEAGPVAVLASCSIRVLAPHATLRLRPPDLAIAGAAGDVERALAAQTSQLSRFYEVLANRTRRPLAEIELEWSRGPYLEAADAVTLGYADEVLAPSSGKPRTT